MTLQLRPSKTAMQHTIHELVRNYGIKARQEPGLSGMMYVEYEPSAIDIPTLNVVGPYLTIESCFVTALHEIGHVHHGHTQGRPPHQDQTFYFDNGVLRSEAEAWNYALDITDEMGVIFNADDFRFMHDYCFGSYLRGAAEAAGQLSILGNGNRDYVSFRYDKPGKYVNDTLRRMRLTCNR